MATAAGELIGMGGIVTMDKLYNSHRVCKYCKSYLVPDQDIWKLPSMDYYGNYWTCAIRSANVNEYSNHEPMDNLEYLEFKFAEKGD